MENENKVWDMLNQEAYTLVRFEELDGESYRNTYERMDGMVQALSVLTGQDYRELRKKVATIIDNHRRMKFEFA